MTEKKKKPYAAPKTHSKKVARAVANTIRKLAGKEPLPTAPEPPAPLSDVQIRGILLPTTPEPHKTCPAVGLKKIDPLVGATVTPIALFVERTPDWEKALALLREARNSVPLSLSQRIDALLKGR